MSNPVLQLRNIAQTFVQADSRLDVLKDCNLTVNAGELVALIGPSGAGKSTLLHLAGLLERPGSGEIFINDVDASKLGDQGRTLLRRTSIGFVYQFHHLLPEFSARENIILPQMIAGVSKAKAGERADELLALVGLSHRADHRPGKLSGGEQQRVAMARALANKPSLLIADEPTGNLDPVTSETVFSVLQGLVKSQNIAILMATHNLELANRLNRVIRLKDGALIED